jgi:hypothetical protein
MAMRVILFIALLLLLTDAGLAQEPGVRPGSRKHDLMNARTQITALKNGALLVRLPTRKHSIEALRRGGDNELADRIEAEQKIRNQQLIGTFAQYFDFCPVYFFFSDRSEAILSRQFSKLQFVNEGLDVDSTIMLTSDHFLTAEITTIAQDTTQYYSHPGNEHHDHFTYDHVKRYYGSPAMGFEALVIKSDQFIQLKRPFPYYVRTFSSLPFKRGIRKTVSRMNRKLHSYYDRSQT